MSINLPTWAYHLGYRLFGEMGTFGLLDLYKDFIFIRRFDWCEVPDIVEIEKIIQDTEAVD